MSKLFWISISKRSNAFKACRRALSNQGLVPLGSGEFRWQRGSTSHFLSPSKLLFCIPWFFSSFPLFSAFPVFFAAFSFIFCSRVSAPVLFSYLLVCSLLFSSLLFLFCSSSLLCLFCSFSLLLCSSLLFLLCSLLCLFLFLFSSLPCSSFSFCFIFVFLISSSLTMFHFFALLCSSLLFLSFY